MRLASCIVAVVAVGVLTIGHAQPPPSQTITTARLVEAARKVLPVASPDLTVTTRVLGEPEGATVPAGAVRLKAHPVVGRWPRARVAVSVSVFVNGKAMRSGTIWFAIQALRPAWVYDQDAPAGTAMSKLKFHKATVDVAKADGRVVDVVAALQGDRLKRGVHAGWPVLKGDFEPIPDVDTQSQVVVHVRYGSIRMETLGRALNMGDVGDVVPVLVEGAVSPVFAKVAGKGVVDIAR